MQTVFSKLRTFLLGQELIEAERRKAVRLPCKFKASVEGLSQPVTVINLSILGLRLESPERLRKNTVVRMDGREHSGRTVAARVIWCHSQLGKHFIGLSLIGTAEENRDSWVSLALTKLGAVHKERERRGHLRLATKKLVSLVQVNGDRRNQGQLRNIGLGGALFVGESELQPRTIVRLLLQEGNTLRLDEAATVRSCRKDPRAQEFLIGLQFGTSGSETVRKFLRAL